MLFHSCKLSIFVGGAAAAGVVVVFVVPAVVFVDDVVVVVVVWFWFVALWLFMLCLGLGRTSRIRRRGRKGEWGRERSAPSPHNLRTKDEYCSSFV